MKHTNLIITHYSIYQSFNKPTDIIAHAKSLGAEACVLCDCHNLSGALEFHIECTSNGIKPIIGVNLGGTKAFAKNLNGWKNLIKAVTIFNTEERLDRSLLDENVLVLDQDLGYSRYPKTEDELYFKVLRALDLKIKLRDLKEETSGFELKIIDSNVFDCIESFKITSPPKLPKFASDKTEIELLKEKVSDGFNSKVASIKDPETYQKRIRYEEAVIETADLAGYFLIVEDFVRYARSKGQLCAIGRGCFTPESRVKTSNELYVPIDCISIGDEVVDAYGQTETVYDVLSYDIDEEILEITFDNKKIIRCTKDHEFLTKRGWIEAQFLEESDDIIEV